MGIFEDITHDQKKGSFDLGADAVTFTSKAGEVSLPLEEIEGFKWTTFRKSSQLTVACKEAASYTFTGFSSKVMEEVESYSKANEKTFKKLELNTCGYNWGGFAVGDESMTFQIEDRPVFDVNFATMSQSVIQGKNEVALEFHEDDIALDNDMATLVEMRVHIPDGEEEEEVEGEETKSAAMRFHSSIAEKADFGSKGEVIAKFDDLLFNVPRGRYCIQLFTSHFLLNGKTFNYKIMYKSIDRMFLLQSVDLTYHIFILGLNPAIRQGRTSYPYLILQFGSEETIKLNLGIEEDRIAEKQYKNITHTMEGPLFDVVSRMFGAVTNNKKIIIPSLNYQSHRNGSAVRCSYKANDGYLYILEKSFFFVKKPAIYVRHDKITSIEFARLSGGESTRTFDLIIHMSDPVNPMHKFASIDRNEYNALFTFFTSKKLHITNVKGQLQVTASGRLVGSTMKETSDSEGSDDPYMNRVKDEGADSGDANSSEDEDFKAAASDGSTTADSTDFSENDAEIVNTSEEDKDGAASDDDDAVVGSDGEVKKKSGKKRKTPSTPKEKKEKKEKVNKPTKARSAYTYFIKDRSAAIKAANPGLSFQELSAKYGEEWKSLDEEGRAPYTSQAKEDMERSKVDRATFKSEHGSPSKTAGKGKKKRRTERSIIGVYVLQQ